MNKEKLKYYVKLFIDSFFNPSKREYFIPSYRILEIFQDEEDTYNAEIQIINKNITFKAKPEEISSQDTLVNQFSPRDIRTLTYLGYLGINNPKYTILAKKLSEGNDKLFFVLKKKGNKKIIIKSAAQIIKESEIINNLTAQDAKLIGYTVGSENVIQEKKLKEKLTQCLKTDTKNETQKQ